MFTVGVYTREGNPLADAFVKGAQRMGWAVKLRSANDFAKSDCEDFNLAFVYTMRTRASDLILSEYARRLPRVPVVVIDYGYLRRANQEIFGGDVETGYYQMSIDSGTGLNSIPWYPCPADRFESLALPVKAKGGDSSKGVVLVCGQHAGDPSHGRMDAAGLRAWADEQIARYRDAGEKVLYRPHPFSPDILPSDDTVKIAQPEKISLEECFKRTKLVVVQNSNTGHDALLAGIPVVATRSDAPYFDLTGEELPSVEDRTEYFSRVAYAQWTLQELREGLWHQFYLDSLSHVREAISVLTADAPITASIADAFSNSIRGA